MRVRLEPPFKTPVFDGTTLTRAWATFFRGITDRQEIIVDKFVSDGVKTEFLLSVEPKDVNHAFPNLNGVIIQHFSWDSVESKWLEKFSLVKKSERDTEFKVLKFVTAPAAGVLEVVIHGR